MLSLLVIDVVIEYSTLLTKSDKSFKLLDEFSFFNITEINFLLFSHLVLNSEYLDSMFF